MTTLRLISALLCLASGLALALQDCELDGVPVNPANGGTTAGKSGIMRCRERDSGQVQREQELRQGEFTGPGRSFYPDGQPRRIAFRDEAVFEEGSRKAYSVSPR